MKLSRLTAGDGEILPPEHAVEKLARLLFSEMEHLDPTEDYDWDCTPEENWSHLDEGIKEIYRNLIHRLAMENELWSTAQRHGKIRQQLLCK